MGAPENLTPWKGKWWWHRFLLVWVRRALVIALIVWGAYELLWADPQLCHQELADDSTAVKVCSPPGATDAPVLLWLVVLLVLLLPEASEIEIAGLFRIQRQIEEAKAKIDDTSKKVDDTKGQVAGLQQAVFGLQTQVSTATLTASQRSFQGLFVGSDPEQIRNLITAITAGGRPLARPLEAFAEFSRLAFKAGFAGLPAVLPQIFVAPELIGFTVDAEGGLEEANRSSGVPDDLVDIAAALVAEAGESVGLDVHDGWVLMSAPALDVDRLVGALVVAMRLGDDGLTSQREVSLRAAELSVAAAAKAYARLLVDLLGEAGNITGSDS